MKQETNHLQQLPMIRVAVEHSHPQSFDVAIEAIDNPTTTEKRTCKHQRRLIPVLSPSGKPSIDMTSQPRISVPEATYREPSIAEQQLPTPLRIWYDSLGESNRQEDTVQPRQNELEGRIDGHRTVN